MSDSNEKVWKTLATCFGGIGLVITAFSIPSAIDLYAILLAPSLSVRDQSFFNKYSDKYVTISGQISDHNSFPVNFNIDDFKSFWICCLFKI